MLERVRNVVGSSIVPPGCLVAERLALPGVTPVGSSSIGSMTRVVGARAGFDFTAISKQLPLCMV